MNLHIASELSLLLEDLHSELALPVCVLILGQQKP